MAELEIRLFGKFSMRSSAGPVVELEAGKALELLSYLLLHRERPHSREVLSELLWGDGCATHAKKYLRQALWQLHTTLDTVLGTSSERIVIVEPEWVRVNTEFDLWLDVQIFEQAYCSIQGIPGHHIDPRIARALRSAADLYQGDLLEDSYQDWCLYEREHLQNLYLILLDKLMAFCEAHGEYENGIEFGTRILRHDRARERTHRSMMRLQYLDGDRTSALHQYQRCATALSEELGVEPARSTHELYQQIRADEVPVEIRPVVPAPDSDGTPAPSLVDAIGSINQLQQVLMDMQQQMYQLQHVVSAVEQRLHTPNVLVGHPRA
jgi:DNA-binding SARP family transcriptional activator